MSTDVIERSKVIQQIAQGLFDDNEDALYDAIKRRRKIVDLTKVSEFQVGDTVVFNSQARPKYLKGVEGSVVEVNSTTVLVQMPDSIPGDTGGRFRDWPNGKGARVRTPVGIVDRA